jgi:hypothetical protein
MFAYGPGGPWQGRLAARELPPPPAGTKTYSPGPDRIVAFSTAGGAAAQGSVVMWARCRYGWACLVIWPSSRRTALGVQMHARWGWHLYNPAHMRDEPDAYGSRPGNSFEARFLPGYDDTLAEALAALTVGKTTGTDPRRS